MAFATPAGTQLLRVLGAGSVFHVALVRRGELTCVCKRLTTRMRSEARALAAVEREKRFLELAMHGAVPDLIGAGEDEHGPYILETAAEGSPLAALMQRGPLPADMLEAVARAAFSTLAEIHALPAALALGDLCPDDVFIGRQRGAIAFVDFGQSSWHGQPPAPEERGTLPYTPPEVARGDALWSQASDVYALAAVMLHAASGREPCEAAGPARLAEIAERGLDLTLIQVLPERMGGALSGALSFERSVRLATARAVLDRFDEA